MPLRLVVSFRGVVQPEPESGQRYLARALSVKKRAEALGATLCAWSAQSFAFDFDPGEIEEAIALAALALSDPAKGEKSTAEEPWSAGIAQGELTAIGNGGSFAVLSWGPALVAATALAGDAQSGEVLLDLDLIAQRAKEIGALDGMVVDFGERRLVRRADSAPAPLATPSSVTPTQRTPSAVIPSIPPVSRPPDSIAGQGPVSLDAGRARRAPTLPPPASRQPSSAIAVLTGSSPSPPIVIEGAGPISSTHVESRPPPTELSAPGAEGNRSMPGDMNTLFQAPKRRPPTFPEISEMHAEPLAELAKRALLQGDVAAVERLITQLRETGAHHELVERMTGLVALRRGATAEALRRLREAAEAVREPKQQARARLAYGVALASAGRTESALLEALEALARARAVDDAQGERACALFLARLSASAGHADAASAWAVVAAQRAEQEP